MIKTMSCLGNLCDMNNKIIVNKAIKIHFIGIGGIGMSGLAEIMHSLGYVVSGSDIRINENVSRLISISREAIVFYENHQRNNVVGKDLVVYSSAIRPDNEELLEAKSRKIPCVHRSDLLSQIIGDKLPIVVSGTHGKTTTTSLCATIIERAGLDPIVINGGVINEYGSNAKYGSGKIAVTESDESDGSFRHLSPMVSIVTNIERDHMDFYTDMDHMLNVFSEFILNTRSIGFYDECRSIFGMAVLCLDCPNIRRLLSNYEFGKIKISTYGLSEDHNPEYLATNISTDASNTYFDIKTKDASFGRFSIPTFGKHNVSNALASFIATRSLGVDLDVIRGSLSGFTGVKRRFTNIGSVNGARVYDDYAHHPTEINTVIDSARSIVVKNNGRIIVVFQPHKHTRLTDLFDGFVRSLSGADVVVVLSVYSVNETPSKSHQDESDLHDALLSISVQAYKASNKDMVMQILNDINVVQQDVVLFVGAGDINSMSASIVSHR